MTIPTYASLGIKTTPLMDTWSEPMPYLDPIQTDFEGGNKRSRMLPGDAVCQRQFDILFSSAEFATFKTYVLTTLSNGTARFVMPVWDGSAMVTKTVQFAQKYQPVPRPPSKIQVTFVLWVYP